MTASPFDYDPDGTPRIFEKAYIPLRSGLKLTNPDYTINADGHCENPCTDSKCGLMVYLYPEKDFLRCPGIIRGAEEWESTYKIRTSVERSINHIKDCFCLRDRKTKNTPLMPTF